MKYYLGIKTNRLLIHATTNPTATGSKSVVLSVKSRGEWGVTSQMMRELD